MWYLGLKLAVVVMVGLAGAAGGLKAAVARAAMREKMRATPSEFDDNALVTFTGIVKLVGEPLIAPLSGKPCVAYRSTARTYRRAGRRRLADRELVDVKMVEFVLVTKSGEVLVDGVELHVLAAPEPLIPRKLELEQRFLDRAQVDARAGDAGFDEIRIEPGAKISVHGVARKELVDGGVETDYREVPMRVRITGEADHPLTIDRVG
jgi:hypothetical protein